MRFSHNRVPLAWIGVLCLVVSLESVEILDRGGPSEEDDSFAYAHHQRHRQQKEHPQNAPLQHDTSDSDRTTGGKSTQRKQPSHDHKQRQIQSTDSIFHGTEVAIAEDDSSFALVRPPKPVVGKALHLPLPRFGGRRHKVTDDDRNPATEDHPLARIAGRLLGGWRGHRMALACDPVANEEECFLDFGDHRRKQSSAAHPGMRLQVFRPRPQDETHSSLVEHRDSHDESSLVQSESSSSSPFFAFHRSYQLLEPVHLELGIAPKHYLDFAYTPVYSSASPHDGNDDDNDDDNEQEFPIDPASRFYYQPPRRVDPVTPTQDQRFRPTGASAPTKDPEGPTKDPEGNLEEESSCVAADALPSGSDRSSSTCSAISQRSQEERRGSAFYSWWKWWLPFSNQWWGGGDHDFQSKQSEYTMGKTAFAGGSHGQVWKGRRVCSVLPDYEDEEDCDGDKPLILKRLKVEQGYRLLEAGLREVYFGNWAKGLVKESEQELFTTYVDHFFRELPRSFGPRGARARNKEKDLELWIVFEDAGPSLRNYLYAPVSSDAGFVMYQHSPLWAQLRTSEFQAASPDRDVPGDENEDPSLERLARVGTMTWANESDNASEKEDVEEGDDQSTKDYDTKVPYIGRQILREILRQILSAVAILHESGIVHRDIKPANVMCTSDIPLVDLYDLEALPNIQCKLGDFSSGWDHYTDQNLYTKGPSPGEQTDEYAPPESYLGPDWVPFDQRKPQSYDSWSVGVLALELLLGTPNVFSVDQRTTVLLTNKLRKEGASEEEIQRALYLAALSHFCIYIPNSNKQPKSWPLRHGDPLHKTAMVKESCTLHDFHRALRARDPLGVGFDSSTDLLLHLIWGLLAWDPMERMTAAEALQHPFFLSPDGTKASLKMMPGQHNALEHQFLDPRLDFTVDDTVQEFICPKCGRVFADWRSCNRHANIRRHAKFCTYDRVNLPTCINTHSMLPAHPTSGYCDLQGRRKIIEDFHSIHLYPKVQFYGIFDGHTGNVASKYVASSLFRQLMEYLPELETLAAIIENNTDKDVTWKKEIETNISQAFHETHGGFLQKRALSLSPNMDQSGTTATAMLVTGDLMVVSNLGDSRAVLSSTNEDGTLTAIQLTPDHVASDPQERALVLERGGFVSSSGGIDRVNGTLAITRSIGDAALAPLLSRTPHVISLSRSEIQSLCRPRAGLPCFVVLASDGLWDVMSNQEAVDMVAEVVEAYDSTDHISWDNGGAFQEAAEVLAVDAYVRGSTDNIGVCVVAVVE